MMMTTVILETERLRLRPYTLDDEPDLYAVFEDSYARMFYPEMIYRENVRKWIDWSLRNYEEFGFGLWAMELKVSGAFVGDCGLTYQDVEGQKQLEIGYHVAEGHRHKGYATEAARACLKYGFDTTSCLFICSIVRPENEASCSVARRVHDDCREIIKGDRLALLFYTEHDRSA
jgi:RimJ/RimL family protein N-acetyltransferase